MWVVDDLEKRRYHLKKRDELAAALDDERFKVLAPYLGGRDILNWVARNAVATKQVLATQYFPINDATQLFKARDEFLFHFRNLSGAVTASVASLFAWGKESQVREIDDVALILKKTPYLQVMNCLRSRLMHGGRVFGSFGSRFNLGGPMRGRFQYAVRLIEPAVADLRGLPSSTNKLVSWIERDIANENDWVTPLVNSVLTEMEKAWRQAEEAFRKQYTDVVRRREEILMAIAIHEHELERVGFFEPIGGKK